jgi:hypothetical protein
METKINSYKEMEKEYDILKEKVKYEEGRFLNNDRKDNEILILREENSNLKKEIIKKEQNSKDYEILIENEKSRIKELKTQLSQLKKKIILLESNQTIHNNNNNNYSTIHNNTISTKGRTSSRWSKRKDKEKSKDKDKEERLQSNNSHLTSNNTNTNHSLKKRKIMNAKYSKLEVKAIGNSNERTLSRGNSTNLININSKKKKLCKGITTVDNNNNSKISETYHKILNSLLNFKTNNNISTKKTIIASSHKKNSSSMCVDIQEKNNEKRNIKRSLSKKFREIKNNTGSKHKIYNKLMNGIPNSKIPLTSKNNANKKIIPNLRNKNFVKNKSFLNIKRKNKEYLNVE